MLDVTLRLLDEGADAEDLAMLRRGLVSEPELRGRVGLVRQAPEEGQMSAGLIALLTISLAGGGAVTAFVKALPALLKARRAAATVEVTLPDGRSVKITADSADDAHALLNSALRDQQQP
ncbi:effector-associated constant component EACC1 [Streptomyces sp. NPDC002853]